MSLLEKNYNQFQEIDYEEFYDLLWEAVPEKVVSTAYLGENRDFIDSITYDVWRLFEKDNKITVLICARIIEAFFFNLFRYRPSRQNIEQILD